MYIPEIFHTKINIKARQSLVPLFSYQLFKKINSTEFILWFTKYGYHLNSYFGNLRVVLKIKYNKNTVSLTNIHVEKDLFKSIS